MHRPTAAVLSPAALLVGLGWAVSLAGLAACGNVSTTRIGGPCEADHHCDDGQVCDMTNPGGPICIDGNGDLDGDGIPNSMDFCEHMAGGAFDEDGDGIGDDCDACPISKPPATPDTDGDGVDSPCDPLPDTPGDKIVLFNGFDVAFPAGWTHPTGDWQVMGGEVVATPDASGNATLQIPVPPSATTPHTEIFASYRVDAVGASGVQVNVVGNSNLPMGSHNADCGSSRTSDGDVLLVNSDSGGPVTTPFANLFDSKNLYRIVEQIDGTAVNCVILSGSQNGAAQTQGAGFPINEVDLIVNNATVRFQYILVVER